MRIVFLGLPLAANLLLQDGHTLELAALSRRGAVGTRRLRRRLGTERVLVAPDLAAPEMLARIRACAPDLLVSWFWTKRVPRAILDVARLGSVGVHPSLLPRHRGPDPYFWAIDAGDAVTGVTAHRLEDDYDTGAIFGQRTLAIDPRWNAWTLARKLDRPSLALLRETVARFAREGPPPSTPQDDARATDAPEPGEDELELHWDAPTERIVRRVRAASPFPGMITEIGDFPLFVTRVEATDRVPKALLPGEAAVIDGYAVVRTSDGAVRLLAAESDDEGALDAEALAGLVASMIVSPPAPTK